MGDDMEDKKSELNAPLPVAYAVTGDVMCYAENSNARQRIRMVGETLNGVLIVPPGGRSLIPPEAKGRVVEAPFCPKGAWQTLKLVRHYQGKVRAWHYHVSNESTLFTSILLSLFSGVPIVLVCWDPPGGTIWDRKSLVAMVRRIVTIIFLNIAIMISRGLLLVHHPGFWKEKCSRRTLAKIHFFPNGTTYWKNRSIVEGDRKVPKRLALACRVCELKNCWYAADFFIRLWKMDNEVSLLWIGGGLDREVFPYMVDHGVPADRLIMPGDIQRDEALPYLATATYGLNLYPDVESLKWNYLIKLPEFLSLGLPVISNDLPGSVEYVREGETGIVIPCHDVETAVRRAYELVNDPVRTEQMSIAAVKMALRYDWRKINDDMTKFMEILLEKV